MTNHSIVCLFFVIFKNKRQQQTSETIVNNDISNELPVLVVTLLAALASLMGVNWIYFKILRITKNKDLVDNPAARKLQKVPVPVNGGAAVFVEEIQKESGVEPLRLYGLIHVEVEAGHMVVIRYEANGVPEIVAESY